MKKEIFRLERVTQIEQGVTLLDHFNLHIFEGEIMGLVCINVQGQEALIQLLSKNVPIHYGWVYFGEKLVNNYVHSSMSTNKVSVIGKQSKLVEDLTVADNIFVLRRGFKQYFIRPKLLEDQLNRFTEQLEIKIDANELVANLSFFEKCIVELIKAAIMGTKLVVIRDISNFISTEELKILHNLMRSYTKHGISFLYICNHHEEAYHICDRVSLMENGKIQKVLDPSSYNDDIIMNYTLNFHRLESPQIQKSADSGILRLEHVCTETMKDISFSADKGECIVLLDMNNTILQDMRRIMLDEQMPMHGNIFLDGVNCRTHASNLKKDVCFIQENPVKTTLFRDMTYLENLCFLLEKKRPSLWVAQKIQKSVAQEYEPLIGKDIYAIDLSKVSLRSLYNLVYYRVHLYHPKIVFCVQPFSGADMYLRHHIVHLINELQKRNITVVILAVSISDSLVVADRLLIVEQGKLREEYHSGEFQSFRKKLNL